MTFDEDDEINWTPVPPLPTIAALSLIVALGIGAFNLLRWIF